MNCNPATGDRIVRPRTMLTRIALTVALALIVSACGGGGGDSAPTNASPTVGALEDRMLTVGDEVGIQVTVTDPNAADTHTVTASSSDTGVAGVSVSGTTITLAAVAPGSATVTVTARDSSGAANAESAPVTFEVTVETANSRPAVAGVADLRLDAGETVEIEIDVTDDDANDSHTITASASDDSVVEVSVADSLLSLKGPGSRYGDSDRDRPGRQRCRQRRIGAGQLRGDRRGWLGRGRFRTRAPVQGLLRQSAPAESAVRRNFSRHAGRDRR